MRRREWERELVRGELVEMHSTELFLWQQRGEVASLRMRAAAEFNFYKRVEAMRERSRRQTQRDIETDSERPR